MSQALIFRSRNRCQLVSFIEFFSSPQWWNLMQMYITLIQGFSIIMVHAWFQQAVWAIIEISHSQLNIWCDSKSGVRSLNEYHILPSGKLNPKVGKAVINAFNFVRINALLTRTHHHQFFYLNKWLKGKFD